MPQTKNLRHILLHTKKVKISKSSFYTSNIKTKGYEMVITTHAAQRFLERVMSKAKYTCFDIQFAMDYLNKVLKDVSPNSRSAHFVLPGFENYKVVYRDNTVITIIPKGDRHV